MPWNSHLQSKEFSLNEYIFKLVLHNLRSLGTTEWCRALNDQQYPMYINNRDQTETARSIIVVSTVNGFQDTCKLAKIAKALTGPTFNGTWNTLNICWWKVDSVH